VKDVFKVFYGLPESECDGGLEQLENGEQIIGISLILPAQLCELKQEFYENFHDALNIAILWFMPRW
jgi:hypothetical protein